MQRAGRTWPVVVVGAGAAGLGAAVRLAERGVDALLLTSPQEPPARTWCSWQAGAVPWQEAVSAEWATVAVHGPDGRRRELALAPYRYQQVRSPDFAAWAAPRHGERREALVHGISDGADGAVVHTTVGDVRASWVLDTRPVPPARPGRTHLLQHFRGWFVRTSADAFDPAVAGFMDFRVPQPPRTVAFGYVLPTSARTALVEYTEFGRTALQVPAYEAALRDYTERVLGLPAFEVTGVEQGVIPMTDAPFPRSAGARVRRLGAAGGATRPSTGFTFAAAQRQAVGAADALADGGDPLPPAGYPRRHLLMDALLLAGLDAGTVDGAAFLTRLFDRRPAAQVLRFLDGATTPAQDLSVMAAVPPGPMLRALPRLLRR